MERVAAFGAVKPGPEGSDEFSSSRCRRSRIGGGISLRRRASSTSPWNVICMYVWSRLEIFTPQSRRARGVRSVLVVGQGFEKAKPEAEGACGAQARCEVVYCLLFLLGSQ